MSDLKIPLAAKIAADDAARNAYRDWHGSADRDAYTLILAQRSAANGVVAALPGVVAAELRRVADEFGNFSAQVFSGMDETARACTGMYAHCAQLLRRRADELDPPTGGETE